MNSFQSLNCKQGRAFREPLRRNVGMPILITIGMTVMLLESEEVEAALGVVQNTQIGDMLNGIRLLPHELGVLVNQVLKDDAPVDEPFHTNLRDCVNCVVQWPHYVTGLSAGRHW